MPFEVPVNIVKPLIGVVTTIGSDHISAFRTIEAIAAEKSKLIAALPAHGMAILNQDDPNVRAMKMRCGGKVITYGIAPDAMVRAEDVRSSWPERLSFTLVYDGQAYRVQTQLCGAHWVPSVLAAISVGIAMKIPLADAVQSVGTVEPHTRRMRPLTQSNDITFIRDDAKAPLWSIPAALRFMKDARAKRKIVIVGTISDYIGGSSERPYVSVAKQALAVADRVIFVGSRASKCLAAKRHPQDDALQAFYSVEAACEHLCDFLAPGDLVLLKGSGPDNLEKIISARTRTQWSDSQEFPEADQKHHVTTSESASPTGVVIGLGNPGEQYHGTPHNVGQGALDRLARLLGEEWTRQNEAMVARVQCSGKVFYLIKPVVHVNRTGPVVLQLACQLGFGPAECVLVHDDIDLPLGSVRMRMRGGDGGHRGVRSVLEAFRTDAIRRIKLGVGRPERREQVTDHVLSLFSQAEMKVVESAYLKAVDRFFEMFGIPAAFRSSQTTIQ